MTRVLTDAEIEKRWDERTSASPTTTWKQDCVAVVRGVLQDFGGSSPEEKREAERAAALWAVAVSKQWNSVGEYHPYLRADNAVRAFIDAKYPSLTPEPPTVTLSGKEWRYDASREQGMGRWMLVSNQVWYASPTCITAEDFEKCRDLLRAEEQAK